jgi:hypothetical protein
VLDRVVEHRVHEFEALRPVPLERLLDFVHHVGWRPQAQRVPFERAVAGAVDARVPASAPALHVVAGARPLVRRHVDPLAEARAQHREAVVGRRAEVELASLTKPDAGNPTRRRPVVQAREQRRKGPLAVRHDDEVCAERPQRLLGAQAVPDPPTTTGEVVSSRTC